MTRTHDPGPDDPVSANTLWHPSDVARSERWATVGGDAPGLTVWLTGLSGSGKSSVAVELEVGLVARGRAAYLLDGDNLRQGLNGDLGFSAADRDENVRRVAHVARLFADAGLVGIVPLISPYRTGRDLARRLHDAAELRFVEVFVDTPLAECERRDPKGLYAKARRGELSGMTGIDDPYEPPLDPELRFTPADGDAATVAAHIIDAL
ncbi:MAG: adenylyl-sulfate kinase [Acidimicrobiales bacterium]